MSTFTFTFNRTHTSVFVADNMRNILKIIIEISGLDPDELVDDWMVLGPAVQTWLATGDLEQITLEFFTPGSDQVCARWDFPISYDGSGVDDEMWADRGHIQRAIAKAARPPANASYRVILQTRPGRPDMPGMAPAEFRGTRGLVGRASGAAVATPDIMAGLKYWRAR
jgi:hypothetical protein